jgi:hypothetical protein
MTTTSQREKSTKKIDHIKALKNSFLNLKFKYSIYLFWCLKINFENKMILTKIFFLIIPKEKVTNFKD